MLVLELEKAEPVGWDEGLFRTATADTEPLPTIMRDVPWTPARAASSPSAETPATAGHATPALSPPSATTAQPLSFKAALDKKYANALDKLKREGDSKPEPSGGAHEIWSDLMSGQKRLLTSERVFAGADAVKAALARQLRSAEGAFAGADAVKAALTRHESC
eukprot:1051783-Prymnesium_polylepis.1